MGRLVGLGAGVSVGVDVSVGGIGVSVGGIEVAVGTEVSVGAGVAVGAATVGARSVATLVWSSENWAALSPVLPQLTTMTSFAHWAYATRYL